MGVAVAAGLSWRPALVAWKHRAGRQALALGEPEAALREFSAAEALDPHNGRTQFMLARTYRRLGDSGAVFERLHRAHDCGFPDARLEREWILAQAQGGLMALAEPALGNLLMQAGDDGPEICAAFANGYVRNYQFGQAVRIIETWQADYPRDPEPHLMLGRIQRRWQNFPAAERHFRAALDLQPKYRAARELLTRVLVEQHKYAEAVVLLESLLAAGEGDVGLRLAWAECLLALGRSSESREVFAEVLQKTPDNCDALLGQGQLELESRHAEAALEYLDRARDLCGERLDIRYARAQALSLKGDREQADSERQYVTMAQAALVRAYGLAAKVLQSPDDTASRMEIGTTLMQYGDREEGVGWLLTILEFDPENQPVHRLLAQYYAEQGDQKRSRRHAAAAGNAVDR